MGSNVKRRNFSAELHAARKRGETVVCSLAPNMDDPVVYAPRTQRDPRPWVLASFTDEPATGEYSAYNGMHRYSGRECHAVETPKEG